MSLKTASIRQSYQPSSKPTQFEELSHGPASARNLDFKTLGEETTNPCDEIMQVEEVEEDDLRSRVLSARSKILDDMRQSEAMSPLSKKDFEEIREQVSHAD